MTDEINPSKWLCVGKSVQGASHKRNQLPNQDAIRWYPDSGESLPLILAVSDGHGSSKNFRSDIGSRLAVETTIRVVLSECQLKDVNFSFSTIKDIAENLLPKKLVYEWGCEVKKDWEKNPIKDQEIKDDEIKKRIPYGATLLAVLLTESFILYIQQGDGDILCVDSNNKITRPFERDERLIGNETTSLCTPEAWKEFRVHLEMYPEGSSNKMPALILVSTDGYANSYSTEEEFCRIGQDYLQMIRSEGLERVEENLNQFLDETSEGGSGDDITLGIISRIEKGFFDDRSMRMNKLEGNFSSVENKVSDLGKKSNSISNRMIKLTNAMIIALGLTSINIFLSFYLFWWVSKLETSQKTLETSQKTLETSQKTLEKKLSNLSNQPKPQIKNQQNSQKPKPPRQ